jgi:hypothetical protein
VFGFEKPSHQELRNPPAKPDTPIVLFYFFDFGPFGPRGDTAQRNLEKGTILPWREPAHTSPTAAFAGPSTFNHRATDEAPLLTNQLLRLPEQESGLEPFEPMRWRFRSHPRVGRENLSYRPGALPH